MDEQDWAKSMVTLADWHLGRLDARSEQSLVDHAHQNRELMHLRLTTEALQRSQQHLVGVLQNFMERDRNRGGAPALGSHPPNPTTDDTPNFLMGLLQHFAPKALTWALGRAFSILVQFLLPILLLIWAGAMKWIGFLLSWLGQALP